MTPEEIRTKLFLTERKGGFNRDEVVEFLEQAADEFALLHAEVEELRTGDGTSVVRAEGALSDDEAADLQARATAAEGLEEEMATVRAELDAAREELTRVQIEKAELEERLASSGDPSSQIGDEVAMVLRTAHEAASDLRRRTEEEVATVLRSARETADELRQRSESEAEEVRSQAANEKAEAERQAAEIVDTARTEADQLVTEGMARHDELLVVQGEVRSRLDDAENVLRDLRDKLSQESRPAEVGQFAS